MDFLISRIDAAEREVVQTVHVNPLPEVHYPQWGMLLDQLWVR